MKKIFFISIFIFSSSTLIFSQRATEARKQRLEQDKIDKLFVETDGDCKTTEVPEQFKTESAVILFQKKEYSFYTEGYMVSAKESLRRRIKLLDKAALEDFSTLYFYKESGTNYDAKDIDIGLGIYIEKPNGTRTQVTTKEAIKVEGVSSVPDYYRAVLNYTWNYYKIAVPNLQIGDIIDFISEVKNSTTVSGSYAFPSMITTLHEHYPVVKQKYIYNIERGFFLNCNTYNGAPQLEKTETGDRKQFKYTLGMVIQVSKIRT